MSSLETGPPLVPIERVAEQKRDTSDKATRKMITQLSNALLGRLDLTITDESLDIKSMRFVRMQTENQLVNVAIKRINGTELIADRSIQMISGLCLFGASGLSGETTDGRVISLTDPYELSQLNNIKVETVIEDRNLHISEAGTILRLSKAFKLIDEANKQSGQLGELKSLFHFPTVEYKLYMLDLLAKRVINEDQAIEIFEKIDDRSLALSRMLVNRLPADLQIEIGSPLGFLDDKISSLSVTSIAEVVDLASLDSEIAQMIRIRPINSFSDLSFLSYAAGYIKAVSASKETGDNVLAVEIAEERPILKNANDIGQQMGVELNMAALYVAPDTVTLTGRHGKQALFMHQSNGVDSLSQLKQIVANARR